MDQRCCQIRPSVFPSCNTNACSSLVLRPGCLCLRGQSLMQSAAERAQLSRAQRPRAPRVAAPQREETQTCTQELEARHGHEQ